MSIIGSFKTSGTEFTGEINTLTIQAKNVRFIPAKRTTDAGPSHRVYAGRVENERRARLSWAMSNRHRVAGDAPVRAW